MTESNEAPNVNPPAGPGDGAPDGGADTAQPAAPAPKRRRRRRWPWVLLGLLVLLLLVVLLLPSLLSMGWARSVVVGQVNKNLNGQVEIGDWSLGWGSGVR